MFKFLTLFFFIIVNATFAQTGKITGRVINSNSGQTLAGATLMIIENSKLKIADQNGAFSFNKLEAGIYSIKCTYSGFAEKVIIEIVVKENENLYSICQVEGIKLEKVLEYNKLKRNSIVKVGDTLHLRPIIATSSTK